MEKLKIIVAVANNNAIGNKGKLLYTLKDDMKYFKEKTNDNVVIMGRKTFESIGKPLSNRVNIVLSSNKIEEPDVIWEKSLESAVSFATKNYRDKKIFVIGGGKLYKEALDKNYVDEIFLTKIYATPKEADVFFPSLDLEKKWEVIKCYKKKEDEYHYSISEIRIKS